MEKKSSFLSSFRFKSIFKKKHKNSPKMTCRVIRVNTLLFKQKKAITIFNTKISVFIHHERLLEFRIITNINHKSN